MTALLDILVLLIGWYAAYLAFRASLELRRMREEGRNTGPFRPWVFLLLGGFNAFSAIDIFIELMVNGG